MRSPKLALGLPILLTAALSAAAAPPPGYPPARPPTPSFGERVDVRVVNVEVVVTDRHGLRVGGLSPADFHLKVDGRPVAIDYFTEVRGGDAVAPPEGGFQSLPGAPGGAPVGTSYLVFIDDSFAFGPNRDEALRNLRADLGRLGPGDRMAIVSFDGRRLDMLASWTSSEAALARALDEAMRQPAQGLRRRGELAAYEGVRGASRGLGPREEALEGDRGLGLLTTEQLPFARQLAEQVGHSVDAAAATLRSFADPPGRKVMLLLAGGWPYSPADYVVGNANRPLLTPEVPTGETLFRPLDDTANLLGYTIYPVDVQGILDQDLPGADRARPLPAGAFSVVRPTELRATLLSIAQETGGQPILSGHHDSPLAIAAADTRSYYWIGFTPDFQRYDARHRIHVDVARPGLAVRARSSYLDLSRRGEATMAVESAMLFGNAPAGEALPVKLGQASSAGWRTMDLPVTLAIPVSGVTFVPLEGKYVAELELRVAALDADGHRSDVPAVPFKLTLDRKPEAGKFIPYDTTVRLRKIDQRLTIAVVDRLSDSIITSTREVRRSR